MDRLRRLLARLRARVPFGPTYRECLLQAECDRLRALNRRLLTENVRAARQIMALGADIAGLELRLDAREVQLRELERRQEVLA